MLDSITPVLLSFNEAPNIHRTISQLYWAPEIIVVDSGSTDDTVSILKQFPRIKIFQRVFDTHGSQWRFATHETGISTPWVLRLDADYLVTDALIAELASLPTDEAVNAYEIAFDYAVFSKRLVSSLYPSNTILLRNGHFRVFDRGHTEQWSVDGEVRKLRSKIVHDDWKSLDRWIAGQVRYMRLEQEQLSHIRPNLKARLRRHPPLMPIAVFLYCLFGKRLIFEGKAGIYYSLQRAMAEAILSLMLLDQDLRGSAESNDSNAAIENRGKEKRS
jgi:glycosyltransferase involved in cell wall biosynthesis